MTKRELTKGELTLAHTSWSVGMEREQELTLAHTSRSVVMEREQDLNAAERIAFTIRKSKTVNNFDCEPNL